MQLLGNSFGCVGVGGWESCLCSLLQFCLLFEEISALSGKGIAQGSGQHEHWRLPETQTILALTSSIKKSQEQASEEKKVEEGRGQSRNQEEFRNLMRLLPVCILLSFIENISAGG